MLRLLEISLKYNADIHNQVFNIVSMASNYLLESIQLYMHTKTHNVLLQ